MVQNNIYAGLNEDGIDFFGNKESNFSGESKIKENIDKIITPIDNFIIYSKIQKHLEESNYFQDVLDIVYDLKENGNDIEKNYHAIVGIGEIQDYYRNKDLQEKIILVLDEVITNLDEMYQSKRKVTEEEEKQLDHIKRFINKRGLKKGDYSSFLKDKLQKIQSLSTKIVNNTKSIENQKGYNRIVTYDDLFKDFGLNNINLALEKIKLELGTEKYFNNTDIAGFRGISDFFGRIGVLQLTKGCSGKCKRCHVNALQRKNIRIFLGWDLLKKISDRGYNSYTDNKKKLFYASDPFDWSLEDRKGNKKDINDLIELFGGYDNGLFTKIPNSMKSIESFKKNWIGNYGEIILTITKDNCDRAYDILKELHTDYPESFNSNKIFSIILKNGKYLNDYKKFFSIYENDKNSFGEMTIELGKDYTYNDKKIHNVFSSSSITLTPDGLYNQQEIKISSLYPEGHKDKKINNIVEFLRIYDTNQSFYTDIKVYDYLIGLIFNENDRYDVNSKLIINYLNNNPSHKLFFKKNFEKLFDTILHVKNPYLFESFKLKKIIF